MPSFKLKSSWVTILQGVEFSIFVLILAWALQQCSATALPVIAIRIHYIVWISLGCDSHLFSLCPFLADIYKLYIIRPFEYTLHLITWFISSSIFILVTESCFSHQIFYTTILYFLFYWLSMCLILNSVIYNSYSDLVYTFLAILCIVYLYSVCSTFTWPLICLWRYSLILLSDIVM